MSSIWGEQIKISVFGESHGTAIGLVIDGLPPGIPLDMEKIFQEMDRRKPGQDIYSTPRKEGDAVEIVSGFFNGYTTGTPLCGIIRNTDKRSKDYEVLKDIMRPSHADYTGKIRYKGFNDYRGGGHFSGRLTAPMVFAGAIANQYLEQRGITIGTHLLQIGNVTDQRMDPVNITKEQLKKFRSMRFPVFNKEIAEKVKAEIDGARMDQDSVGGMLETAIINLPAGLGSPMFQSVESRLAAIVFSIPATKGIEFGSGFEFAAMRGSKANDPFEKGEADLGGKDREVSSNSNGFDHHTNSNEHCKTLNSEESGHHSNSNEPNKPTNNSEPFRLTTTNHTGGINGGITNGMPVLFRTAFRPTASISKMQQALDFTTMQVKEHRVHGRHDPCIAVRAVPVIDAAAALVVMDLMLENNLYRD